jgi:preprotein translocase subunit SecB
MWRLDLKRYFYPEIFVKARKEHMNRSKESTQKDPEIEVSIGYALNEQQKAIMVDLSVSSVDLVDEDPYELRVQVFGSFNLTHSEDKAELDDEFYRAEKLLVKNCAQILVGSIRDTVLSATAKSAYRPLYLNTIYISTEDIPERIEEV